MANYLNAFTRGTNLNNVDVRKAQQNKRLMFRAKMDEKQKLYIMSHPRNTYHTPFQRTYGLIAHNQNPMQ